MYRALVLVGNFHSSAKCLDFGEFKISNVEYPQSLELQKLFSSQDVFPNDWLFEKDYAELPDGPAHAPAGVGGIPNDIEDILLLLRLYKVGDLAFVKQAIVKPDGTRVVQLPYRLMNDINSNSVLTTELTEDDREPYGLFANGLRTSQAWESQWFSVARRFFLYGGAKEFNPKWDEADRIVDYVTALEAAVVPEHDFSRRRISRRAARLVSPDDPGEQETVGQLVKELYDIRSSIVHGSKLSGENREWLIENCGQVERRVRQVLAAAALNVPSSEEERQVMLSGLFDPTDEDRGEFAYQKFQEIKTDAIRKEIARKISEL